MKIFLYIPNNQNLLAFLRQQKAQPFSYSETGRTKSDFPKGYNHDHNEVRLGEGREVFLKAKEAIRSWSMFPAPWTQIYPADVPPQSGQEVVVLFRLFGLWWLNSCRIVYMINEATHFGFAYGTLPAHIEKGEEQFSVEIKADGSVWYRIKAFSWPRHWLARLAYPVGRYFQRKFVRDSFDAMKKSVE